MNPYPPLRSTGGRAACCAASSGRRTVPSSAGAPRYLRVSNLPKLVLDADPGSILPGSTAIGLCTPNTTCTAFGPGYHYLVEDAPGAIVAALLSWLDELLAGSEA